MTYNKPENITEEKIIKTLQESGITDFVQYLRSPWRIFWSNILAGISRGFGIILGMTVILALVVWIISRLVNVPLIGAYFKEAQTQITEYTENTNYKEEFQSMEELLREIRNSLKR